MARRLLRFVPKKSLLIADRNFHSAELWDAAKQGGFAMLLRIQSGPRFRVIKRYPDNSYLSEVLPRTGPNKKNRGILIRMIECEIRINQRVVRYRFATNLLRATKCPAEGLVMLYHRRWEMEGAFGEFKSQLAGRDTPIRSASPKGVMAELDALLLGYYVVRRLACDAARRAKVQPLELSFRHVVQVLTDSVRNSRCTLKALYHAAAKRRNRRRMRSCPRCKKVVRCPWPVKTSADHQIVYKEVILTIIPDDPPPLS